MTQRTAIHLALVSALYGLAAFSVSAAEMGSAPVRATPSAAKMGAVDFITAPQEASRTLSLAAPSAIKTRSLKQRRLEGGKRGQPFEIGFSRPTPDGGRIALNKLSWQPLGNGRLGTRFEISAQSAAALRAGLLFKGKQSSADTAAVTFRFAGNDGLVFEQSGRDFAGSEMG